MSFVNGEWLPHSSVGIHVEDMGFRQGVVAVERMRTYHGVPFEVDQHFARWKQTTEILLIDGLPSKESLRQSIDELLRRNMSWVQPQGDVGITLVATPGSHANQPTLVMHLNSLNHPQIQRRRQTGQPLVVTEVVQPDNASWPRGIKTRARIHYYLADQIARSQYADAVGVLLDQDGSVTETSIANLAICRNDSIVSPPADRVLGGITQSTIESCAAELGMDWRKVTLRPNDLREANEVLLMGTDGGIWFAHSVDGTTIGTGQAGPLYSSLLTRFDERTRQSEAC